MGYNTSLMTRLFKCPLYSPVDDTAAGKKVFNTKYITQLVRNYRSHKAILHVANELFYGGALKASASDGNLKSLLKF